MFNWWIAASDRCQLQKLLHKLGFLGCACEMHGKAVDAAVDRFTDKKDLGGGGEFRIRAAHRFPAREADGRSRGPRR